MGYVRKLCAINISGEIFREASTIVQNIIHTRTQILSFRVRTFRLSYACDNPHIDAALERCKFDRAKLRHIAWKANTCSTPRSPTHTQTLTSTQYTTKAESHKILTLTATASPSSIPINECSVVTWGRATQTRNTEILRNHRAGQPICAPVGFPAPIN